MTARRISVLGSTGSVGTSTLDLLEQVGGPDTLRCVALTAGRNVDLLIEQARRWRPEIAVIADEGRLPALRAGLAGTGIETAAGSEAVVDAARRPSDWAMAAIVGAAGLAPTWAATDTGATLALANKESLVCCGPALLARAEASGGCVIPVDSEHSAIFQALGGQPVERIARLLLTASGGPFRDWPQARMAAVTPEQAVDHPNWSMGAKISVDSATMANKGLETIEAAYLFGVDAARIEVLVHPQSIVHSLVEFTDGSTMAQLGTPDMRTPIAVALTWPQRADWPAPRLDLAKAGQLTFEAPDEVRFPALRLAREALVAGGCAPAVFNAANERAVQAFLDRRLGFLDIAVVVEDVLGRFGSSGRACSDGVDGALSFALEVDGEARGLADDTIARRVRAA